ncbi:unnamed protein product [Somion occarium]|uniref:Anaphase-promoting complex subunit 4 n=1 Tax=Somion occarium TaxID=3059160 RepID=A0ABP1CMI8_9APHY
MDSDAFISLANIRLPTSSRLLPSSWCPDKDLFLLVSRSAGRDKLSLWKMQGAKKWEVTFDSDQPGAKEVVDVAWSPDGTSIAVAHHPPAITLHTIEDGRQQILLPIDLPQASASKMPRLKGIWWTQSPRRQTRSTMPDLFKRRNVITGSAHSILRGQPLLDPLHDELQALSSSELFAFQGSSTRTAAKNSQPDVISSWPSLTPDLLAASLKQAKSGKQVSRPGEEFDESNEANTGSSLVASDHAGNSHCFLDGRYSLGSLSLGESCFATSLHQDSERTLLLFMTFSSDGTVTSLDPCLVRLPFLQMRYLRDLAKVSSSTKELTWYAMRVVKEMRAAWFGSDTQSGARELGPKWLRAFEARQRDQFGELEPNPMVDLTYLLVTGRTSDPLSDYLGSGEQMSERGILKWDQTVSEALVKLRDYSEKRLIPACQRIHLLLEETLGWSQLPEYAFCALKTDDIRTSLTLARSIIICASWLGATARRELIRFRDFLNWVRYEIARANSTTDVHALPPPRHDPLEVNDYLMSGLVVSSIDRWFMGPVPHFSEDDLRIPNTRDLETSIQVARETLENPRSFSWPPNVKMQDLSRLDRNLDALMQELATHCQKIFSEASKTALRSAVVVPPPLTIPEHAVEKPAPIEAPAFIREQTILSSQEHSFLQYLAIQTPHASEGSHLCLLRMTRQYGVSESRDETAVAILQCLRQVGDEAQPLHILDAEFFDEQDMIVVYRLDDPGPTFIATVDYANVNYRSLGSETVRDIKSREEAMNDVLQRMRNGELSPVPLPINQTRALSGCREGRVTLSVNGRVGRRVACVLDDAGLILEVLDMEGEVDEEEGDISQISETADATS